MDIITIIIKDMRANQIVLKVETIEVETADLIWEQQVKKFQSMLVWNGEPIDHPTLKCQWFGKSYESSTDYALTYSVETVK